MHEIISSCAWYQYVIGLCMNLFGARITHKTNALPLVLLAAVFFIFQGADEPDFPVLLEPELSSSQKTRLSTGNVVKTSLKSGQTKIAKTAQRIVFFSNENQLKTPAVRISALPFESLSFAFAAASTTTARAPPA